MTVLGYFRRWLCFLEMHRLRRYCQYAHGRCTEKGVYCIDCDRRWPLRYNVPR